jgi:hypothetical protein
MHRHLLDLESIISVAYFHKQNLYFNINLKMKRDENNIVKRVMSFLNKHVTATNYHGRGTCRRLEELFWSCSVWSVAAVSCLCSCRLPRLLRWPASL